MSPPEFLDKLNEGLLVTGPDHRERRQAAFSALVELGRLDIVKAVWSKDGRRRTADFGGIRETNLRLAAHLTRRWNRIAKAFGESFWDQVGWVPDDFLMEWPPTPQTPIYWT